MMNANKRKNVKTWESLDDAKDNTKNLTEDWRVKGLQLGVFLNKGRPILVEFKRYTEKFVLSDEIVYFSRRMMNEDVHVPIFSTNVCKNMHIMHGQFGHMGNFKFWDCMKDISFFVVSVRPHLPYLKNCPTLDGERTEKL